MKMPKSLIIDPQFKNLIPPLQRTEYLQLEENLLADGCRDPLVVWRGTLVDGHNRYEICMRHRIPFFRDGGRLLLPRRSHCMDLLPISLAVGTFRREPENI